MGISALRRVVGVLDLAARPPVARAAPTRSARPRTGSLRLEERVMLDLLYLAVALAFFALASAYVRGCNRL